MKKIRATITSIIPAAFLLILTGCTSFPVLVSHDPFHGGITIITADMWHSVIDSRIDNTRVLYAKYIKNGEVSDPTVTFEFVARSDPYYYDYHGESLAPDANILADGRQFTVSLTANENIKQGSDVARFYFFPGVLVRTDTWHVLIGKITLTPEMQQAILSANRYMIRFYIGDAPLTLQATQEQLGAVKKFLASRGEPAPEQRSR